MMSFPARLRPAALLLVALVTLAGCGRRVQSARRVPSASARPIRIADVVSAATEVPALPHNLDPASPLGRYLSSSINTDEDLSGRAKSLVRKARLSAETRQALVATIPSDYSFSIAVPRDADLEFACGVPFFPSSPAPPIQFSVTVQDGGRSRQLFSRTIDSRMPGTPDPDREAAAQQDREWQPARVSLKDFGGRTIQLRLSTRWVGAVPSIPYPALWGSPVIRPPTPSSPNVLMVSLDTLRADRLGSLGYRRYQTTPFLDSLANRGALFADMQSQAPHTAPSHLSMFTSRYPHQLAEFTAPSRPTPISPAEVTLAEVLQQSGYRTAAFSTFTVMRAEWGYSQGFDFYLEQPELRYYTIDLPVSVPRLVGWWERNTDRPAFVFLHTYVAHAMSKQYLFDTFAGGLVSADGSRIVTTSQYDSGVRFVDDELRLLFGELEARGLLKNTLVVITSDHGEDLWDRNPSQRPWTVGHGHTLYNEMLHVVGLVYGPSLSVPQGKRITSQARLLDIAPTILDYLGIAAPQRFVGKSLRPMIDGSEAADRPSLAEAVNIDIAPARRSLSDGRLKYIQRITDDDTMARASYADKLPAYPWMAAKEELYDLASDPAERHNIAGLHPDWVAQMRQKMSALVSQTSARGAPSPSHPGLSEADKQRLKALGYL